MVAHVYIVSICYYKSMDGKQWRQKYTKYVKPSRRDAVMIVTGGMLFLAAIGLVTFIKGTPTPLKPESSSITTPWIPETVKRYEKIISEMGQKYDIDPNLIAIITTMESGGYPKAKSGVGAEGLMQVIPATAKDIAARYTKEPRKKYDLYDPQTNIEFGTAYLAMLRDEYGTAKQGPSWDSTVELIAAAYNGGFVSANNLEQGKGIESTETVVYSRDAFNMWRERHANKSLTFERWKERGGIELINAATKESTQN